MLKKYEEDLKNQGDVQDNSNEQNIMKSNPDEMHFDPIILPEFSENCSRKA